MERRITGGVCISAYTTGIKGLDILIGEIPLASNILVIGPPLTGKGLFARTIMYNGLKNKEAGIYISTKDSGSKIQDRYVEKGLSLNQYEDAYGIVDCVSRSLGPGKTETSKNVAMVGSAVDMTGISIAVGQFLEEFWRKKQIKRIKVVMESLSNLLMYSNSQTVYRFLHVFTGKVRAVDGMGVYTLEEGMHDSVVVTTLKQLVQGVIEIKDEGDKRFLRASGITPMPTEWAEYTIENNEIVVKGV
ncbi:recombinase RecA [archaeon]|nr:recombinase RecA [archaeon]